MNDDGLLEISDIARGFLGLGPRLGAIARLVANMANPKDDKRESLGRILERTARRYPHRIAVKHEGGAISWRAFNARVNRVAHTLRRQGVRRSDTVAILLENRPAYLVCVAAVAKLGAISSLLNANQRRAALEHSLECAPPRACVVGEELWEPFSEVRQPLPDAALLWVSDSNTSRAPPGAVDLIAASLDAPSTNPRSTRAVRMGDPAFYVFTSGTTGLPKASIMSHKRWLGAGLVFGGVCLRLGPRDTVYAPLPLYHNQALTLCWSSAVRSGAAIAIRRRFSATAFWGDCRRHEATAFAYIGEITQYLLAQPPSPGDQRHAVAKAVGVGMRPDAWEAFERRFGIREIYEYYSASELNAIFFNVLNLDRTVGWCPVPWALVAVDPTDDTPVRGAGGRMVRVGRSQTGLLITKVTKRIAFEGYSDAEATERKLLRDVFEPGDVWVHTGDLMRDIGFGHLQFVDRIGDTFRWKSENVATTEVEAVARHEPTVSEAAVYGVRVPSMPGRAGMIAAVASNGAIDRARLLARLRRELPPYAVPLFLRESRRLETTGTFKIVKSRLRDDGFDPARVSDPLFVCLPGSDSYAPLTPEIFQAIEAREVSL